MRMRMRIINRKDKKIEIVTFEEKLDMDKWSTERELEDLLEASKILKIEYLGPTISDESVDDIDDDPQYHFEYEIKYITKD